MVAYLWTLSIALAVVAGFAIKYRDERDNLAHWIQINHPEDLEK